MMLALTADSEPAWFGTDKGKSHALMTSVAKPGGDHIGSLTLTYTTVHGWSGKSAGMSEQFDNHCGLCEKWLTKNGEAAVKATLDAYKEECDPGMSVADMIMSDPDAVLITVDDSANVITLPTKPKPKSKKNKAKPIADTEAVVAVALTMSTDAEPNGPAPVPDASVADIKARSADKVESAPAKVLKCAVSGTHKVSAKPGTDDDGITGTCPVCQTSAKLTTQGFIGTHNVNGAATPVSPTLSQRAVLPVDTGMAQGDPSSAEKRRNSEAYTVSKTGTGKNKVVTVTPNIPRAEKAGAAIGGRDHGALDGPAMMPKGTYSNGSVPDKEVIQLPMAGGKRGYLTQVEYAKLSRTAQRKYFRKIGPVKSKSNR